MLHLQHATVVADKNGDAKQLTDRCSIQEEREVAEKVRSKPLRPKGGKVFRAEYKIRQEMRDKGEEAMKQNLQSVRLSRKPRRLPEKSDRLLERFALCHDKEGQIGSLFAWQAC